MWLPASTVSVNTRRNTEHGVAWVNVVAVMKDGSRLTMAVGVCTDTGTCRAGAVYEYCSAKPPDKRHFQRSIQTLVEELGAPFTTAKMATPTVMRYPLQTARIAIENRNLAEWPVDCPLVPAGRFPLLAPERTARIVFDDANHIYYVDGVQCPFSVTGVVSAMTDPFVARRASREDRAKARKWKEDGRAAGVKGTIMHAMLEMLVNTGYASVDPRVACELKYFYRFVNEVMKPRGWRVVATEPLVFSDPTDKWDATAGSVDLVLERPDGKLVIVDYKCYHAIHEVGYNTIRPAFNHLFAPGTTDSTVTKCSMQISIYASIIEHHYGRSVAEMYTLVLNSTHESYILLPCDDLKATMYELITTHHAAVLDHYRINKESEDADEVWMHEPDDLVPDDYYM